MFQAVLDARHRLGCIEETLTACDSDSIIFSEGSDAFEVVSE